MKIGTCSYLDKIQIFIADGDAAVLPGLISHKYAYRDVHSLINDARLNLHQLEQLVASGSGRVSMEQLKIMAPIPRPAKNIMCLGWNYSEHVQETSALRNHDPKLPEHPVVFTKSVTSVTGPGGHIFFDPGLSTELDWEVELGVIIGTGGKQIERSRALDHVFGYTIINDVSARDLQFRHQQFFIGKSLDGACPMGPWIVTADEIEDPQNLDLSCRVNGIIKQDSNTRHMIFDIATTIEILSKGMVLEPGDIIATGTPDGVGFARKPPEFLRPGDLVECEIGSIGNLANRVSLEPG